MGNLTNPVSIAEQGTGDMYDKWDFTYTYQTYETLSHFYQYNGTGEWELEFDYYVAAGGAKITYAAIALECHAEGRRFM